MFASGKSSSHLQSQYVSKKTVQKPGKKIILAKKTKQKQTINTIIKAHQKNRKKKLNKHKKQLLWNTHKKRIKLKKQTKK